MMLTRLCFPGTFRFFLACAVLVTHSSTLVTGLFAVFLFFFLSGFWIGHMWEGRYTKTSSPYITFLISRYWRLWPCYFICLLLADLAVRILSTTGNPPYFGTLEWNAAWLLRAAAIITAASQRLSLGPAWSLDIEMQFYIVAPLLVIALATMNPRGVFMVVVLAGALHFLQLITGVISGHFLSKYLFFFLAGLAVHRLSWKPLRWQWISSVAGVLSIYGVCADP